MGCVVLRLERLEKNLVRLILPNQIVPVLVHDFLLVKVEDREHLFPVHLLELLEVTLQIVHPVNPLLLVLEEPVENLRLAPLSPRGLHQRNPLLRNRTKVQLLEVLERGLVCGEALDDTLVIGELRVHGRDLEVLRVRRILQGRLFPRRELLLGLNILLRPLFLERAHPLLEQPVLVLELPVVYYYLLVLLPEMRVLLWGLVRRDDGALGPAVRGRRRRLLPETHLNTLFDCLAL